MGWNPDKKEIETLLTGDDGILERGGAVKREHVGNVTYLRGLIELSNRCRKNCYYCGIRSGNGACGRYTLTDEEVLSAAAFAAEKRYGSIAVQAGEDTSPAFTRRIARLVERIKEQWGDALGITLSLGEQEAPVYRMWRQAGAERYLLRIETSDRNFYAKLHPCDGVHDFDTRLRALDALREADYQVGSGVMIGLPGQTAGQVAADLLFLRDRDIDMCGMGPYLEHPQTPLYELRNLLLPQQERLELSLRAVAILRLLMPRINIAATTALQAIDPTGRERALRAGANVVMPNITPLRGRDAYRLYDKKPVSETLTGETAEGLFDRIRACGDEVGFGMPGTSLRYRSRH